MADTAHRSTPELLTLHAVRLKGLADDAEVASRFDLDRSESDELLLDYEAYGWVTRSDFAGTTGWSMTAAGRQEDERRLADELQATGALKTVHDAYREFLPVNARLLKACTDWQLRPTRDDPLAANDHSDIRWDQQVLAELAAVGDELDGIGTALGTRLERFQGYDRRFHGALTRALNGEPAWVTRPRADSCHTVWMELHEDLLATLGVDRGTEALGENVGRAPLP
ncbi:MAG TPA: transcriptional regulator [Lapillicoccus sp.]|nr:transcriptional regulator [Lapillicoccus sp.]